MEITELNQKSEVHAPSRNEVSPQGCSTCSAAADAASSEPDVAPSVVYALGRVEARFPSLSLEKEFAQVTGRATGKGQTDTQMFQSLMSERTNRYLARQLCWVLTIQGLETYLLQPRDPMDLDLLLLALRPAPSPMDIDAVIGLRCPMASP